MNLRFLIFNLSIFTLVMCSGQKKVTQPTESKKPSSIKKTTNLENGTITLKEGENKFLKEYEMNVTFQKLTEDSRCPEGVNCVWEGVAVANVQFMGTYTRPVTVDLATTNNPKRNYMNFTIFNGYKITLVRVNPYPTKNSGKSTGNHEIVLRFEKNTSPNSTKQTEVDTK